MWKQLAVGLAIYAAAGTTVVWSQTPAAPPTGTTAAGNADLAALSDARLAALKLGLKLKPDQEKGWTAFEGAIRDLAKQRQDRFNELTKERQNLPKGQLASPADIMRLRAKSMSQAAADMTRYADAIDPLYKSLDDEQRRRMLVLTTGLTTGR